MIQIIFYQAKPRYSHVMELLTKNMHVLKIFELDADFMHRKPFEITELFNGERRRLLEIKLSNGEVLKNHKAAEPITVFCISGNGVFKAGENLEDEIALQSGMLLTLEAEIPHEVIAKTELRLLLTKFKKD
jgi:quercetin dioxygenase-like cupin family protein